LSGAAAITAVVLSAELATTRARGAAPPVGRQAPGFYRYKVGDFEITVVTDGARSFDLPDTFVVNAKKEEVNAALESAFMPKDKMTWFSNPIAATRGSNLIPTHPGPGPAAGAPPNSPAGLYQQHLAAAGIDVKAIDTVIISHYHQDHVDGLLTADGQPAFPN